MARKQGGLLPIGEAFGGLDGPVKAIREASPQALHHFTQADQVHQLVGASEADAERGFMARLKRQGGGQRGHENETKRP